MVSIGGEDSILGGGRESPFVFHWLDGTVVGDNGFVNWQIGEPNHPAEDYMGLLCQTPPHCTWVDVPVSMNSPYICQKL